MGFNMIRVHQLVEPDRFYYWCDKLGVALFQDMPAAHPGKRYKLGESPQTDMEFKRELSRMVETHWNHPSIVMWDIFNKGWGQHGTKGLVRLVKKLVPTRLVDSANVGIDEGVGSVVDLHCYPGPCSPTPEGHRAAVLGESGGPGFAIPEHLWKKNSWGYKAIRGSIEFLHNYRKLFEKVSVLKKVSLSAAVYTQLTDVETDVNGLMTYDRKIMKIDPAQAYCIDRNEVPTSPGTKAYCH